MGVKIEKQSTHVVLPLNDLILLGVDTRDE